MVETTTGSASVTLPADDQILITREFNAARSLVWKAWTTPELMRRWWHAGYGEMTVAEIDLRVGGQWRSVMVLPDGTEIAFHGEYREIVPDERLVSTEVYEGLPGAETVNTATFTDVDGRTRVEILVQHKNQEARDAQIATGMETGLQKALDLLEEVAISLR